MSTSIFPIFPTSIFNDVIGPIMRGPSSGHTAATWRMGNMTLQLLGEQPQSVECRFHKFGAYANVFRQQRSDHAFAAGLMNLSMQDKNYDFAFEEVKNHKIDLTFTTPELMGADHPNEVEVIAKGKHKSFTARFRSIGGGISSLISINEFQINFTGNKHALFLLVSDAENNFDKKLHDFLNEHKLASFIDVEKTKKDNIFYSLFSSQIYDNKFLENFKDNFQILNSYQIKALMFPVFNNQNVKQDFLEKIYTNSLPKDISASSLAIEYETKLLNISESEAEKYLFDCINVMENCVQAGLGLNNDCSMKLLKPLANKLIQNKKNMLTGGLHSEVALYAMAAAEWNASGGLIVAAPTAGSGAILPAVVLKLSELGFSEKEILKGMWAAGLVGLAIADLYTFAGGVGGCQVEIGAAGSMAAALIVEVALNQKKETDNMGLDTVLAAATLFLQNSLGLVCDPVNGFVELPCISRNATAASQAFVCADLALTGWKSPITFYDTVLAMKDVGQRMAAELRCTSIGGLASRPLR